MGGKSFHWEFYRINGEGYVKWNQVLEFMVHLEQNNPGMGFLGIREKLREAAEKSVREKE